MQISDSLIGAWRTSHRTTAFLIEAIPPELWDARVPGIKSRRVRTLAAHLHNIRCRWIRTLGEEHGIRAPDRVNQWRVTQEGLLEALPESSAGIEHLLRLGLERGGRLPTTRAYTWRNLPLDVGHVLAYFVGHEAHHRGQIVMVARQVDQRFPDNVTGGLWQWVKRSREAEESPSS